jgi:uncharacterized membrane protein YfcA
MSDEKSALYYLIQAIVRVIEGLLSVGGIAGLIGLVITVTICVRYAETGSTDIPQILTYSLSTIIGFYFGAGVSRAAEAERRENSN